MNSIKIKIWGFPGCKICSKQEISKEDLKYGKINIGERTCYITREFDSLKNKVINISNIRKFLGLVRFYYKGYCCVIDERNI